MYVTMQPRIHFGKAEAAIAIADLQATFLQGVDAHCNHIFYEYFSVLLSASLAYVSQ